jgi:hypothetical protein
VSGDRHELAAEHDLKVVDDKLTLPHPRIE